MQGKVKRAIVSVSDKRGVVAFAKGLAAHGVEILSTGGTARALIEQSISVRSVSDYTGAPEILDGRVKTLHPKIHGGILGRSIPEHQAEMQANDIGAIDLVVVNLYPFEATVAKDDVALADAIENIDIGGPTMLRSAAKNWERVAVVVDPEDYPRILSELADNGGILSEATRFGLAQKAFTHTAAYDGAIAGYLTSVSPGDTERRQFPDILTVQWQRALDLRYGENPHQSAAFYRDSRSPLKGATPRPSIADAEILQGKALSYNNIIDLDAALACCVEFSEPTAVVVKHTNPCGVACDEAGVAQAYVQARACDPTSAFGGIVAVNREVNKALAELLVETFLECVVAPSFSTEAQSILARKKNLRLAQVKGIEASTEDVGFTVRSVVGGLLVQSADYQRRVIEEAQIVTTKRPDAQQLAGLDFAWRVAKHVKSNAIVFCKGKQTVAIGAGQMSRIDSVKLCKLKAQVPLEGSCVASDAFFPFRDGVDAIAEAGAGAIIQPGGSIRDEEVIAAANERGIPMAFTGMRHFRH